MNIIKSINKLINNMSKYEYNYNNLDNKNRIIKGKNLKNIPLYKITNIEENHHGFKYNDGENIDTLDFNATGDCMSGGLYFFQLKEIDNYTGYGCYIRQVFVDDDEDVYCMSRKFKAHKINVGQKISLNGFKINDSDIARYLICYINIKWFHPDVITNEILELCWKNIKYIWLSDIPENYRNEKICMSYIKKDVRNFKYIPKTNITILLIETFIKFKNNCDIKFKSDIQEIDNFILEYIKNKMIDDNLNAKFGSILLKLDYKNLLLIDPKNITKEMANNYMKENILAFKYWPKKLMTLDVCIDVIKKNISLFEYCPAETIPDAIKNNIKCLNFIPDEFLKKINMDRTNFNILDDQNKIKIIVKIYPETIDYLPDRFLNYDVLESIIKIDDSLIDCIPNKIKNINNILESIVKKDGLAIRFIPGNLITIKIMTNAIEQNSTALKFCPLGRFSKKKMILFKKIASDIKKEKNMKMFYKFMNIGIIMSLLSIMFYIGYILLKSFDFRNSLFTQDGSINYESSLFSILYVPSYNNYFDGFSLYIPSI